MFMTDADMLPRGGKTSLRSWWLGQIRRTHHVWPNVADRHEVENGLLVRWARSQRLSHASGKGWFAVGDAAYAFDPLASQGIAKGLEGARQSADVVTLSPAARPYCTHADRTVEAYDDYPLVNSGYYLWRRGGFSAVLASSQRSP
jgi:2-polyprenyl-6-methoxyphenol hydroxylase-like FAD-dependent oxidoreductase